MIEPNGWLKKYAAGYGFLTRGERRAVSDFVMLWSVYEAQVLDRNATAEGMLTEINKWHAAGLQDSMPSDESWRHFVERLRDGADVSHRFVGLKLKNLTHLDMVKSAVLADPPKPDVDMRHKAMALIVHRIRNNLLHGEKWSYGLADQLLNFRHASHMLILWMDIYRVFTNAGRLRGSRQSMLRQLKSRS